MKFNPCRSFPLLATKFFGDELLKNFCGLLVVQQTLSSKGRLPLLLICFSDSVFMLFGLKAIGCHPYIHTTDHLFRFCKGGLFIIVQVVFYVID
ncbi:hypothetical protein ACOSQ2_011273 [Xanthoceras sorbifolium]